MPHIEAKYIIFESALLELFKVCPYCCGDSDANVSFVMGTLVVVQQKCCSTACNFRRKWYSQPFIGNLPAGNVLLSASILYAGASPTKVLRTLSSMNVASIAYSTYLDHQRKYLQPAIVSCWERNQFSLIGEFGDDKLTIGGDGRCDSPGHTAKYGSYTFLELQTNKVLHIELVQVIFTNFFIELFMLFFNAASKTL